MRGDDDAVLASAHRELEALIGLGDDAAALACARIDAVHLVRAVELVDDGEVEPPVRPGTRVVGVVDRERQIVVGTKVVVTHHRPEAQRVALGAVAVDGVGQERVTRLHDPRGGVRRVEGRQIDQELVGAAIATTSSQFGQLASRGREAVVGMGTVIPPDRSLSIRGARHQLGEHLRGDRSQGRQLLIARGALGLEVGQRRGVIAHPGVGIKAGIAPGNG